MRNYNQDKFFQTLLKGGVDILFSPSLFYSICVSILSFIPFLIYELNELDKFGNQNELSTLFGLYTFFLGTFLSFRLNSSFGSWSKGVLLVGEIVNKTKKILIIFIGFVNKNGVTDFGLVYKLRNLLCRYINHTFYMCSGQNSKKYVDVRKPFLDENELQLLNENDQRMNIYNMYQKNTLNTMYGTCTLDLSYCLNKDLPQVIEAKFYNTIVFDQLKLEMVDLICHSQTVLDLHPSEKNMLLSTLEEITSINNQLFGMVNIPVVYVYNQLINLSIMVYLIFYTLIITPSAEWFTPLWVFITSFTIFLANNVSNKIDNPFGEDKDDIELEIIRDSLFAQLDLITVKKNN